MTTDDPVVRWTMLTTRLGQACSEDDQGWPEPSVDWPDFWSHYIAWPSNQTPIKTSIASMGLVKLSSWTLIMPSLAKQRERRVVSTTRWRDTTPHHPFIALSTHSLTHLAQLLSTLKAKNRAQKKEKKKKFIIILSFIIKSSDGEYRWMQNLRFANNHHRTSRVESSWAGFASLSQLTPLLSSPRPTHTYRHICIAAAAVRNGLNCFALSS